MSTLLGSERPEGAMRKEVASGILKGVGDNAPIEMATINRIGHLENDALRAANSTYSPLYCDYEFWLQRMQGFDGIGSIALAAEVDETWAGGFFAYPVPMRGPRGEPVRGCKLEGLVVLEEHRGKKYLFDGGTYEKISVRLSKAILKECFLEGYQIIFGCPNLLANPVHKRAGHGFVDLTSYRLSYCLQFRGWHRTNGKQRLARFGVFLGNRILSLLKKGVDQVGVITEASGFTTEMDDLDDLVAVRMPGI